MSDSSTSAAAVVNPYAVKRAPPINKPFNARPLLASLLPSHASASASSSSSAAADDSINENERDSKPAALASSKTEASAASSSSGCPGNLPQWQRLPSQHLSFASAEILTIPECHACLKDSAVNATNKSISVTGVVRYMMTHAKPENETEETTDTSNPTIITMVSIVLGDPLAPLRQTQARRSSYAGPFRRVSFTPARPRPLQPQQQPQRQQQQQPQQQQPQQQLPSIGFQTPHLQSQQRNRMSSSTVIGGGLRKRPNSSISMTPIERLFKELAQENIPTVWIQANPAHVPVQNIKVGQLLTVFGEVRQADTVMRVMMMPELQQQSIPNDNTKNDATATTKHALFLQARILRDATGTNMKLYTDALLARRQLLQRLHPTDTTAKTTDTAMVDAVMETCDK